MAPIALAFAVLAIEDSASALGQVLAARSIPMVLFLLLGGVLADRLGRRLVIQVSNVVSAVSQALAAWLVITGQAELWHLVVIEAVNGTSSAASFPAMQGMVPQLVPRSQLQSANALLSMVRGALVDRRTRRRQPCWWSAVGPGWALAVDAATWLVAALLLVPVRVPRRAGERTTGVVGDLREGWTLLPHHDVVVGRGAGLRRPQRDHGRRLAHARAGGREGHHRHHRLGLRALGRGGRAAGHVRRAAAREDPVPVACRDARLHGVRRRRC